MSVFIFSDITCDYPTDRKRENFEILPFSYSLDDDNYDNVTTFLSTKEFYERMRTGAVSKTSQVSPGLCEERLRQRLAEGFDVIYLVFSSALSGTFNTANLIVRQLKEEFPDRKIAAIDTLNASLGEGLLVDYVLDLRDRDASFEDLCEYAQQLADTVCSYFTVDDLKHLARLGRVSKTAAFIGELAQIKPVLYVNKLGELVPITKVMSRKKSLKALVDKMEEKMLPAEQQKQIFIGHGDCVEDAQWVARMVSERFGIANVTIGDIGPVIGSHTNAGVVALFFLGTDKIEAKDARVSK